MASQASSSLNTIYLFLSLKGSQRAADSRGYIRSESMSYPREATRQAGGRLTSKHPGSGKGYTLSMGQPTLASSPGTAKPLTGKKKKNRIIYIL